MKKLYSLCFVFLMLIPINTNVAVAQEIGDITGIYRSSDNRAILYTYEIGVERFQVRRLDWDNPGMFGIAPPDRDITLYLTQQEDDIFSMTSDFDSLPIQSELYQLVAQNGEKKFISLASTQSEDESARTTYVKVADLYTEAGKEGPLAGIFCGDMVGDYTYICIKVTPTSEEVWIKDAVQADNYPPKGTLVEYSIEKYNVFDPRTLTSSSEDIVVSIQPK